MAAKGTRNVSLAFGDFEISVAMSKAQKSRDLKLETVDPDGKKVTASRSSALPAGVELSKAVRIDSSTVVRLDEAELKAEIEASKERLPKMQVLETVDYRQVPTERIVASYWLQPAAGTARALALLDAGLRAQGRVAVVKWIGTSREKLGVIRPRYIDGQHALLLSEISFANEFAGPDEDALSINEVQLRETEIAVASELVAGFARQPGGVKAIDEATDTAVDAQLAIFRRERDRQLPGLMGMSDDEKAAALEDERENVAATNAEAAALAEG